MAIHLNSSPDIAVRDVTRLLNDCQEVLDGSYLSPEEKLLGRYHNWNGMTSIIYPYRATRRRLHKEGEPLESREEGAII